MHFRTWSGMKKVSRYSWHAFLRLVRDEKGVEGHFVTRRLRFLRKRLLFWRRMQGKAEKRLKSFIFLVW